MKIKSTFSIEKNRFDTLVQALQKKKILIVGDVGVDRYTLGTAHRLSPEAPVPVVIVHEQKDKLGLAANVADNVKSFGGHPVLASLVGSDRFSEELFKLMDASGIDRSLVMSHGSRRTTLKERVVAQNQQVVRIDHENVEPLSKEAEDFYLSTILPSIAGFDGLIMEDYGKGLLTNRVIRSVVEEAQKHNIFITVDPTTAVRSPEVYKGVSLFKPNLHEAERLSGVEIRSTEALYEAGKKLQDKLECPILVITEGKEGMTLFTPKEKPLKIPTFAHSVYDVSGAGDTVISMLALAMVSGASLVEAALLANFAAGVEVGKPGTATVSLEELLDYMLQMGGILGH